MKSLAYKVTKKKNMYTITEKGEERSSVIVETNDKNYAYRLATHLNLGGGFDGNTPLYFCSTPLKVYK